MSHDLLIIFASVCATLCVSGFWLAHHQRPKEAITMQYLGNLSLGIQGDSTLDAQAAIDKVVSCAQDNGMTVLLGTIHEGDTYFARGDQGKATWQGQGSSQRFGAKQPA